MTWVTFRVTVSHTASALMSATVAEGVRRTVFNLSARNRRRLARLLRRQEGIKIDPKLLTEGAWECLIDALTHRRQLLFWLTRYCNLVEVR